MVKNMCQLGHSLVQVSQATPSSQGSLTLPKTVKTKECTKNFNVFTDLFMRKGAKGYVIKVF
jgi:hypothetical protein